MTIFKVARSFNRLQPVHWLVCVAFVAGSLTNAQSLRSITSSASVSVTDFGAIPDGRTDNSDTLARALAYAASHLGVRLHFPCSNGGYIYRITRSFAIPDMSSLIADGAESCKILYDPVNDSGSVMAAFTITGVGHVTIEGLTLEATAAHPPPTILLLGRIKGGAGANKILNSTVRGYATKALVFSQTSENNIWQNDTFRILGGGAKYGFYTSSRDDLGICPKCEVGSNLSLYFQNFVFVIEATEPASVAIADQMGGGTGDHYFERGYIGLNRNPGTTGFEFISGGQGQAGPNSAVDVRDVRIENGGFGFRFKKNIERSIYNVNIEGVTWSSGVAIEALQKMPTEGYDQTYFAYGDDALTLSQCTMSHNLARQHATTGPSSFYSLLNSTINEAYGPITIRSEASGNIFMVRPPGRVSVSDSQLALNAFVFGNAQAQK
jgi:hypothetical protein